MSLGDRKLLLPGSSNIVDLRIDDEVPSFKCPYCKEIIQIDEAADDYLTIVGKITKGEKIDLFGKDGQYAIRICIVCITALARKRLKVKPASTKQTQADEVMKILDDIDIDDSGPAPF